MFKKYHRYRFIEGNQASMSTLSTSQHHVQPATTAAMNDSQWIDIQYSLRNSSQYGVLPDVPSIEVNETLQETQPTSVHHENVKHPEILKAEIYIIGNSHDQLPINNSVQGPVATIGKMCTNTALIKLQRCDGCQLVVLKDWKLAKCRQNDFKANNERGTNAPANTTLFDFVMTQYPSGIYVLSTFRQRLNE
ncbi:unnamed protein product [Rotaria sp. Silwood1]|nr:unnamed protein product [Rotaria sp. Silwood1]CAF1286837.1 unnamed protein product [Rotaria sp. Silwood1]CAF3511930.1 unnamed protein product [Rotaria sp. Silwood1]CAF3515031.1 unnamed protein product [Rotaria sp. Silwood1]CAF4549937.1 unnamed protein product [Rotaria sp. Silwood1]